MDCSSELLSAVSYTTQEWLIVRVRTQKETFSRSEEEDNDFLRVYQEIDDREDFQAGKGNGWK